MSIDELVVGEEPGAQEEFARLCKEALGPGSGAGAKLLAKLMLAVPPMAPSISTEGANDPMTVGVREGRREMSAFLFRWSGTVSGTRG